MEELKELDRVGGFGTLYKGIDLKEWLETNRRKFVMVVAMP